MASGALTSQHVNYLIWRYAFIKFCFTQFMSDVLLLLSYKSVIVKTDMDVLSREQISTGIRFVSPWEFESSVAGRAVKGFN